MNTYKKTFVKTSFSNLSSSIKIFMALALPALIWLTMSSYLSLSKTQHQLETHKLPFKGKYSVSIQPMGMPPIQQIKAIGQGNATHLGKSKFEMLTTANFTTIPITVTGNSIFYGANGNQLFTSIEGTSTPNGDGTSTAIFIFTITGGTGKFQNAMGTFTGTTIATIGDQIVTTVVEGEIIY